MCSRFQYSIPKGGTPPQWRRQRGIMPLNPVVLTSIIRTSDISNPEVGTPVFSVYVRVCFAYRWRSPHHLQPTFILPQPLAEFSRQDHTEWDGATRDSKHAPRRTHQYERIGWL